MIDIMQMFKDLFFQKTESERVAFLFLVYLRVVGVQRFLFFSFPIMSCEVLDNIRNREKYQCFLLE
jgi:hypothetical protein